MLPTFQPGQHLYVKNVTKDLAIGDVVVFKDFQKQLIVHRIYDLRESIAITRGDNNSTIDKNEIILDRLVGRVEQIEKNGTKVQFNTSKSRFLKIRAKWIYLDIQQCARRQLNQQYKRIIKFLGNKYLSNFVLQRLCKKIVLKSADGELVKYVLRGKTIAYCWPNQNRFFCKKPLDLFIGHHF